MQRTTLALARDIDRTLVAVYAEYQASCDEDREQGNRPHYCEHGMNQWVNYDPICGWCENGITYGDPLQRRCIALQRARELEQRMAVLMDAYNGLRSINMQHLLDQEALGRAINEIVADAF